MKTIYEELKRIRNHLYTRKKSLQDELAIIEADLASIERALLAYSERESSSSSVGHVDSAPADGRFALMSFNKVVVAVLSEAYPEPLRAAQIAERAVAQGYRSGARNLQSATFAMLSILTKRGQIEKVGKGWYRARRN